MATDEFYRCPHPDCPKPKILIKNKGRHLRLLHGKDIQPRGRPKKHRTKSDHEDAGSVDASRGGERRQTEPLLNTPRLTPDWWENEPWYQDLRDKQYHWNRNGFLEKLLQLPRLDRQTSREHEFVRFINPCDLPKKSEADALRALRNHYSDLKFYSKGQFDDAAKNERYPGEIYDTLLFNMSAPPRSTDPRYAKIPLDELEFDYSRAHIDRDFLYNPQQAEMFASPAGSWSDIHIDHCLAGLAMPVGNTMKLFVGWPACEQNLKLVDEEPPGPERLMHIFDRLEGGRCAIADEENPVYLASGCLHAVVTLRGGIMYAGNFMTAGNGPSFLRSFRFSPAFVGRYDDSGRDGLVANILDQVDITLENPSCWSAMIAEMIESWPALDRLVRKPDKKTLAQWFLKVAEDPKRQQVLNERSDVDWTRLEEIIWAVLKRHVKVSDSQECRAPLDRRRSRRRLDKNTTISHPYMHEFVNVHSSQAALHHRSCWLSHIYNSLEAIPDHFSVSACGYI